MTNKPDFKTEALPRRYLCDKKTSSYGIMNRRSEEGVPMRSKMVPSVLSCLFILVAGLPASAEPSAAGASPVVTFDEAEDPLLFTEQEIFGLERPTAQRPRTVNFDLHGDYWVALGFGQNVTLGEGFDMFVRSRDGKATVRMDLRRTDEVDLVTLIDHLHKFYMGEGFLGSRSWVAMDGTLARFDGTVNDNGKRNKLHVQIRPVAEQPEYTLIIVAAWPATGDARKLKTLERTIESLQFE